MAEKKPVQQAVPTEAETDAHVDDLVNKALKALEEIAMCLAEKISESANFLSKHEHGEQNVQI